MKFKPITYNQIINFSKTKSQKRISFAILPDKRFGIGQLGLRTLKLWKSYFKKSKKSTKQFYINKSKSGLDIFIKSEKTSMKTTNSTKYKINNLPVIIETYNVRANKKVPEFYDYVVCKKIFKLKKNNWDIQLIIEKVYSSKSVLKCANKVNWDNNDNIYIECHFHNNITKLKSSDIDDVRRIINHYLSITDIMGGYPNNSTNEYILNRMNDICKPNNKYRFLSNLFAEIITINRNLYYNEILNKLSPENPYCINNGYNGIDYIIAIDSDKNSIYYINKGNIVNEPLNLNIGFCVISTVKYKNKYIIKKVIIENDSVCQYSNVNDMNDMNKKYSKILSYDCVSYDTLSNKNYKTCLEKYKKNIGSNKSDFIELSLIKENKLNNKIYQWSNKNIPIIFYCMQCPDSYLSNHPVKKDKQLYFLFLTNNKSNNKYIYLNKDDAYIELFGNSNINSYFSPIYFTPSTLPNAYLFYSSIPDLDKQYVSLIYDFKKRNWDFIEKSNRENSGVYGYDFKDVELYLWNNYRNPVQFSDLIIDKKQIASQMYFINKKQTIHEAPIKMNNFVKRSLIKRDMETVIDLASGRGSDLWTYNSANVKNLLFAEIDKDAIDEVIGRKYQIDSSGRRTINLNIINANLNDPYKKNLLSIKNDFPIFSHGVTNIFCFFALHYLTDTTAHIKNITALISKLLQKDGEFVYTSFDETAVIDVLNKNNGKWTVMEGGTKKYEIIEQKTKDSRKAIKLILPFNRPDFYYTETLINDTLLDKEFSKCGLKVKESGSFMDHIDRFKEKKYKLFNRLTEADKIFIGLYKYKIYTKT